MKKIVGCLHPIKSVMLIGVISLAAACGGGDVEDTSSTSSNSSSSGSSSSSSGNPVGVKSNHVLAEGKSLYVGLCSACHGDVGQGVQTADLFLGPAIRKEADWSSVDRLVEKIDTTMPPGGADDRCDLNCSKQISAYILAGYDTTGNVHPEIVFEDDRPKVSTLKGLGALPDSTQSKLYSARSAPAIPTTIQAEHFDAGGNNVSYSDTTPGNVGSKKMVRDDTDVDFGTYDGGIVSIGWFETGEWVDFSFYLEKAAVLNIGWQVASAAGGRQFKWSINSSDQGIVAVPNTGAWSSFIRLNSDTPYLDQGWHTIRVESFNSFNLDYLRLSMADRQPIDVVELDYDVDAKVLHRLTKVEYLNTVNTLFNGDFSNVVEEFENDTFGDGFDRVAKLLKVDSSRLEKLFEAAGKISSAVMGNNSQASQILNCTLNSTTVNSCGRSIVSDWGLKFARRPLESSEVDKHLALLRTRLNAGANGAEAVEHWLKAMLMSTSFLHHVELEPNSDAQTDTFTLAPYELANRLSFFLWCTMPDQQLFDLAASGEIVKNDVLSQQIDRMLSDSKSSCLIDTISNQWLRLSKVADVASVVQSSEHPGWKPSLADDMVAETKTFVMHLIQQNRPVSELLSAGYSFMSSDLANFYGLNAPDANGRVSLAGSERKGLLTQGSILTLNGNGRADIHRGIFVLKNVLCDPPPPPPDNVDTSMGTEGGCQGCHRFIDPVGDGLAHFNEVGRYNTVDPMGNAISAEGFFVNGPSYNGATEMIDLLVPDERVPGCVMENFMSYALASEADDLGSRVKGSTVASWESFGLGFRDMLEAIVTSPAFKYRRLMSAE